MTEQFNQQRAIPIAKHCRDCERTITVWYDPMTKAWPKGDFAIDRHYLDGHDLVVTEKCEECVDA